MREFRALFVTQCLTVGAASVGSLALGTIIYTSTGSPVLSALAMFGGPLIRLVATWFFAAASDLQSALPAIALVPALLWLKEPERPQEPAPGRSTGGPGSARRSGGRR